MVFGGRGPSDQSIPMDLMTRMMIDMMIDTEEIDHTGIEIGEELVEILIEITRLDQGITLLIPINLMILGTNINILSEFDKELLHLLI